MTMKKYLYDEIIEKIREDIEYFENSILKDNNYQLFFANGDIIKYSFHKNNIAHLIGLDLSKLVSYKIVDKEEIYEMLKKLINDPFRYWQNMKNVMDFEEVFSPYVNEKLDNFKLQLQTPYPNQVKFVCKYNRERNYMTKEIDGLSADYYIAHSNEEGDIVLLGLVKKDDSDIYVPQTTRVIKNDDKFNDTVAYLLKNQVITYLNGLSIYNRVTKYSKTINLNTLEILSQLQYLCNLEDMTDSIPCTIADHCYNLKTLTKNKDASYGSRNVLLKVNEKMISKEIIELSDEDMNILDDEIINLIDVYNDSITNGISVSDDSCAKYSELRQERDEYKKSNLELIDELKHEREKYIELQEQLKLKENEINDLNEIKNDYEELNQKVMTFVSGLKK